jgi:hypothetical protein
MHHTGFGRGDRGCVGRSDRHKLAQHRKVGAVPVNRLCAWALANATPHLPGTPESRYAAKTYMRPGHAQRLVRLQSGVQSRPRLQ